VPETEFHCLCDCTAYHDIRLCFYDDVLKAYLDFSEQSKHEQFKLIMSEPTLVKQSAKYCYDILLKRTDLLDEHCNSMKNPISKPYDFNNVYNILKVPHRPMEAGQVTLGGTIINKEN
jgi:hypothetical protein